MEPTEGHGKGKRGEVEGDVSGTRPGKAFRVCSWSVESLEDDQVYSLVRPPNLSGGAGSDGGNDSLLPDAGLFPAFHLWTCLCWTCRSLAFTLNLANAHAIRCGNFQHGRRHRHVSRTYCLANGRLGALPTKPHPHAPASPARSSPDRKRLQHHTNSQSARAAAPSTTRRSAPRRPRGT